MKTDGHTSRILVTVCTVLTAFSLLIWIVLSQFFNIFAATMEEGLERRYWLYLTIVIVLFLVISLFIVTRILYHFTRPVDEITAVAEKLAAGDYKPRTAVSEFSDLGNLAQSINKIAQTGQETHKVRAMEKERLKTLIESIGSSLLMLGRGGTVNLMNGVFAQTFHTAVSDAAGKSYKEIGLPPEAEELIENVFLTEQVHEQPIRIRKEGTVLDLNVYGAPVIGRHGNWLGIIIVFHDISNIIRLEEIRKDFVANVSHELRTPVTSIKGFAETLLDGALDDPVISREFIRIIEKESTRLHSLVTDLLELSGIEQHSFRLDIDRVNIPHVISEAHHLIAKRLDEKRMTLTVDAPEKAEIEADGRRVMQILVNLLANAVAYSKPGTAVRISARFSGDDLILSVADEGIGIEADKIPRLFERFYRADLARSRESGGTGLGLAIVKHLAEAHGGDVRVESEVGRGSEFFIRLPIRQASHR